jgi:hypothetical protein
VIKLKIQGHIGLKGSATSLIGEKLNLWFVPREEFLTITTSWENKKILTGLVLNFKNNFVMTSAILSTSLALCLSCTQPPKAFLKVERLRTFFMMDKMENKFTL